MNDLPLFAQRRFYYSSTNFVGTKWVDGLRVPHIGRAVVDKWCGVCVSTDFAAAVLGYIGGLDYLRRSCSVIQSDHPTSLPHSLYCGYYSYRRWQRSSSQLFYRWRPGWYATFFAFCVHSSSRTHRTCTSSASAFAPSWFELEVDDNNFKGLLIRTVIVITKLRIVKGYINT